jgi:hypothetical protein
MLALVCGVVASRSIKAPLELFIAAAVEPMDEEYRGWPMAIGGDIAGTSLNFNLANDSVSF